jgi:hypothetical protein
MTDKILIDMIETNHRQGTLDHKWLIRMYLSQNQLIGSYLKKTTPDLIDDFIVTHRSQDENRSLDQIRNDDFMILLKEALLPFEYLANNRAKIKADRSLNAITQLCTSADLINNIIYEDTRLSHLAQVFNQLVHSNRTLHLCYDCGTVARGVFFSLIKAFRGSFDISPSEITRISEDYRMDRYSPQKSLEVMAENFALIDQDCLYLCALQFGEKFGHIYVIEKLYKDGQPVYRLFQSCFNSFMLIDDIEYENFANRTDGLNIVDYTKDMGILMEEKNWDQFTINVFCKWFHFYPSSRILKSDVKRIASTYLIY